MPRPRIIRQILVFCFVGFILSFLYNTLILQNTDVWYIQQKVVPNTRALHKKDKMISKHDVNIFLPLHIKEKISCSEIIQHDKIELKRANDFMQRYPPHRIKDEEFINKTTDCIQFRKWRRYDMYPIKEEERYFPIAFSILTYKDVDQTERLLHAIYRPQNLYCIHVDRSSPVIVQKALSSIADCFGNVFLVSKPVDVIYNHMSRLTADLNCMSELLSISKKWKYFINLPSQNFPLKTNLEIVKILKIYNGANDIEGIISPHRMMKNRFKYRHRYNHVNKTWERIGLKTDNVPYNASIVKGSAYGIFSRKFVDFVINDQKAKDILNYLEDVQSPDEYYWSTLNHNIVLQAPGHYSGNPENKPWLAVHATWGGPGASCYGRYVRGTCVFGVGDLNFLVSRKELFANKFYPDYQYLALDCLEEYIYNKTFTILPFDSYYYRQLPFINRT